MPDLSALGGYLTDGGHVVIAETMPTLRQATPQALLAYEPTQPILLYKAWSDLSGGIYPPYPAQQIGDCVSFGHAHAHDLLQCIEVFYGVKLVPAETDTEAIYGMSREVAGILGNSDGSYGAAAAKAMITWGLVSRKMLGNDGAYSGQRAKSWGRTGVPDKVKQLAKNYLLGGVARIANRQDAISALANGQPYSICSDQGFSMTRDAHGFCRPKGSWGHCMFVAGWRPPPLEGFLICQSWGADTPDGPLDLDQPGFSFWCPPKTMINILSQGDSWALSHAGEFVPRSLPAQWQKA